MIPFGRKWGLNIEPGLKVLKPGLGIVARLSPGPKPRDFKPGLGPRPRSSPGLAFKPGLTIFKP